MKTNGPFFSFYIYIFLGSEDELQLVLIDTVQLCGNPGHDNLHAQPKGSNTILKKTFDQSTSTGPLSISQNFRFEISEIFGVKRKGFFHAGKKLAISLVDRDGARSW